MRNGRPVTSDRASEDLRICPPPSPSEPSISMTSADVTIAPQVSTQSGPHRTRVATISGETCVLLCPLSYGLATTPAARIRTGDKDVHGVPPAFATLPPSTEPGRRESPRRSRTSVVPGGIRPANKWGDKRTRENHERREPPVPGIRTRMTMYSRKHSPRSLSQFNPFDRLDPRAGRVSVPCKACDNIEHAVRESSDIQDVIPVVRLRRPVGLEVDAN